MTIHDQDTDPSTPGSRRNPGSRPASTDPGLGPPSQGASGKPMGVVVPPVGPARQGKPVSVFASARTKDSVELLLEGIAGPRPDRVRTMPQTGGEAAAAYHAEHAVRAAHTSPDDQPKVMIAGGPLDVTEPSNHRPPLMEVPEGWGAADPTHVPPRPMGRRIAVAALAGLAVVLAIFVALDRAPPPPITPTPVAVPATPVEPVIAPTARPVAEPVPEAPPVTSDAPSPAPSVAATPQARARKARPRPGAPAPDLGEFKTTF